jgi:hypothetical protein
VLSRRLLAAVAALLVLAPACANTGADEGHARNAAEVRGAVLAPGEPRPASQDTALRALSPGGPTRVPVREVLAVHRGQTAAPATRALPRDDTLGAQLRAAIATARRLMRRPHLERAGYYLGSYYVPGIGVHYIDWRRVTRPFDPAHPAMLLVDAAPGHALRLAGFSYWVRSPRPPEGFHGAADVWHQHRGLCFVDGLLARDGMATARACKGTWLNGGDLWMLHVWVVPGYENAAGVFAPTNRALCPPRRGPETAWC